jgi:hypothetical protein
MQNFSGFDGQNVTNCDMSVCKAKAKPGIQRQHDPNPVPNSIQIQDQIAIQASV